MKDSKLVLMTSVILAMGFITSNERIHENKPDRQQLYLTNHQVNSRSEQPQKEENKYPEKFPAAISGYNFSDLKPKGLSKL